MFENDIVCLFVRLRVIRVVYVFENDFFLFVGLKIIVLVYLKMILLVCGFNYGIVCLSV